MSHLPGRRGHRARTGCPTFIQGSEPLGAHGEVGGEPQREDGAGTHDGGGQLEPR